MWRMNILETLSSPLGRNLSSWPLPHIPHSCRMDFTHLHASAALHHTHCDIHLQANYWLASDRMIRQLQVKAYQWSRALSHCTRTLFLKQKLQSNDNSSRNNVNDVLHLQYNYSRAVCWWGTMPFYWTSRLCSWLIESVGVSLKRTLNVWQCYSAGDLKPPGKGGKWKKNCATKIYIIRGLWGLAETHNMFNSLDLSRQQFDLVGLSCLKV